MNTRTAGHTDVRPAMPCRRRNYRGFAVNASTARRIPTATSVHASSRFAQDVTAFQVPITSIRGATHRFIDFATPQSRFKKTTRPAATNMASSTNPASQRTSPGVAREKRDRSHIVNLGE